jgi:hypothetical protein
VDEYVDWLKKSALVVLLMSCVCEIIIMASYHKSPWKKEVREVGLDALHRVFLSAWMDLYNEIFAYSLTGSLMFCIIRTGERIQTEAH